MPDEIQQDKDRVLQTTKEHDINFVSLWFTDLPGVPEGLAIDAKAEETLCFRRMDIGISDRVNLKRVVCRPGRINRAPGKSFRVAPAIVLLTLNRVKQSSPNVWIQLTTLSDVPFTAF